MSFASLIGLTPDKGLKILKGAIEQTLNKKIENFEMIYNKPKQTVAFKIFNPDGSSKLYDYDESKKLCIILDQSLKDKVTTDQTLDYAIVRYKEMTADLFLSSPIGKKKQTISLI